MVYSLGRTFGRQKFEIPLEKIASATSLSEAAKKFCYQVLIVMTSLGSFLSQRSFTLITGREWKRIKRSEFNVQRLESEIIKTSLVIIIVCSTYRCMPALSLPCLENS